MIDAFILAAILLATKLMKPSEPHHVYGYAATVTLPTTHLYYVILCWTYLIHLDFIHHLQLRPKPLIRTNEPNDQATRQREYPCGICNRSVS